MIYPKKANAAAAAKAIGKILVFASSFVSFIVSVLGAISAVLAASAAAAASIAAASRSRCYMAAL